MNTLIKRVVISMISTAILLGISGCGAKESEKPAPTGGGNAATLPTVQAVTAPATEPENSQFDFTVDYEGIKKGTVSSGVAVHDPSILQVGDIYYIYGSHMSAARSSDLRKWKRMADGYDPKNPVFGQIFSVEDEAFAYSGLRSSLIRADGGGPNVWAPDVIYNKTDGLYYMYYCTTSTWNASNLCYGVSESPEGPFEWKGALIYSGFTMDIIDATDVLDYVTREYAQSHYIYGGEYNFRKCPNAIDPTVFYDADDRMWMVYGSWSGGIFLLEIDPTTGLCIHPEADPENNVDPYFGKRLLGGEHKSIEGPYIIYDEQSGYYYLFVSYGGLASDGGYQIRVFRSKTVDGEYVDMKGHNFLGEGSHAFYGLKLSGNYMLPSLYMGYKATGHNSAFIDTNGKKYVVFHTRFDSGTEVHSPRVNQFLLNAEGWPCMLPYQTQGETVSETGYASAEVIGRYFMVNQGGEINAEVAQPVIVYLLGDGSVVGKEISGSWSAKDGTYLMNITLGECKFSGVFCRMFDEAGTDVMTFSAVGGNETIWGVKYDEA